MSRLPNFIYIGPDKAGSSWIHETLVTHPEVYLTPAKDLYYFDRYYSRGSEWYAAQFQQAREEAIVGEVCQDYLFHPEAALRIHKELGQIQTMVSLRDPVERAWSSYLYMRKHGLGPDTFAEALRTFEPLIEHGRYASGLHRFLEYFPRESIHIALFDDLVKDPQGYLDDITDFLGISRMPLDEEQRGARLPAAEARWMFLARAVRSGADWVREHDGARIVGRIKRSPLVHKMLYREIDKTELRPESADVEYLRDVLGSEVDALESEFDIPARAVWGW